MKQNVLILAILSTLFFACKKEDNRMDLSGTWKISFLDHIAIDSIDASGKPYLNPNRMATYSFDLISLNKENTLYKKVTWGPPGMNFRPSSRTDTIKVDNLTGAITMTIFDNNADWGFGNQEYVADFSGFHVGYTLMEGNAHYDAIWFCRHCPSGSQYPTAHVVTSAIAQKQP